MRASSYFQQMTHDPKDPDPWLALYLDQSIPVHEEAKAALLLDLRSKSRQFLLPIVRPLARLAIILNQLIKTVIPKRFTSTKILHRLIVWGLRNFATPEANILILRHFHIGSELLMFIRSNMPELDLPMNPLKPNNLEDLKDDLFLKHDLNIFNFVINLNRELKNRNIDLTEKKNLDFSAITDTRFPIEEMPNSWTNVIDVQTAIEIYTPLYQLFLTDSDFWRASNSLQLDETIALYVAKLLGNTSHVSLVNNKHPIIPESTLKAGFRLLLHGLAAESLHAMLVSLKTKARLPDKP